MSEEEMRNEYKQMMKKKIKEQEKASASGRQSSRPVQLKTLNHDDLVALRII